MRALTRESGQSCRDLHKAALIHFLKFEVAILLKRNAVKSLTRYRIKSAALARKFHLGAASSHVWAKNSTSARGIHKPKTQ